MPVEASDYHKGATFNGFIYIVEVPLEYPDRWLQLCACYDSNALNAVIATMAQVASPDEWPIRIQKLPVREA